VLTPIDTTTNRHQKVPHISKRTMLAPVSTAPAQMQHAQSLRFVRHTIWV
jgi:hypothetical protein